MSSAETSDSFPVLEEAFPVAADGIRLYRVLEQPQTPSAVVLLTHGLGEHSARYGHVIHALKSANVAVVRYDLRGHGRSDGPRGHASGYGVFLNDQTQMVEWTRSRFSGLPLFLYGHSLGGNLVANWILRHPEESSAVTGAVLSSPWFRLTQNPTPVKVAAIKTLATLWPNFPIPAGFRPKRLMRNEQAIEVYENDPLIHRRVSARLVGQAYDAGFWALSQAEQFSKPNLCLHGGADSITDPNATVEFSSRAPNSVMHLFPNLVHEPHNEPEWREVVALIRDWVLDQSSSNESQLSNGQVNAARSEKTSVGD